jgi:hypothetical protein
MAQLVLGVCITFIQGLGTALIILLPGHLLLLCLTFWMLLARRKQLNLEISQSLIIFFEILVVPSYMVAIVKKICAKQTFHCDGYVLVLSQRNQNSADRDRICEDIDEVQLEFDPSTIEFNMIQSYRKNVGLNDE